MRAGLLNLRVYLGKELHFKKFEKKGTFLSIKQRDQLISAQFRNFTTKYAASNDQHCPSGISSFQIISPCS
jgi:hypothetical protein